MMSHCAKRWAGPRAHMWRSWAGWRLCGASVTTSTSAQSAPSVPINGARPLAEEQLFQISSVHDAYDTLFLARGKVRLQTCCRQRLPKSLLESPDSSKTQSIVGMVLIILPPPPADSEAMNERHGNAMWTGRCRHVGVQRAHFPLSQAWSTD